MGANQKKLGNRFQEDFVKSVPKGILIERYKDSPTHYRKVDNPADYWTFNSKFIVLVECKTTNKITFPLSNISNEQIKKMLTRCTETRNVFGGFLIEYRELQKCFFIPVDTFIAWYITRDRESLPFVWVRDNGIEISGVKKRTRFRWNVQKIFDWMEENCYVKQ